VQPSGLVTCARSRYGGRIRVMSTCKINFEIESKTEMK
jgi:hypothetical protein